jgi:hypothetical protein
MAVEEVEDVGGVDDDEGKSVDAVEEVEVEAKVVGPLSDKTAIVVNTDVAASPTEIMASMGIPATSTVPSN